MTKALSRPALVAVVGFLGFLVAVSFNTTQRFADALPERANDLVDVVHDLEEQRTELQDRLAELRTEMDALEKDAADDSGVRESYSRELETAREAAGMLGVTGPGLEVVLGDGSEVAAGTDPNDYVIHDTDIAAVVNALFAGGAEAVDINGERVVATTPVRCAGTTILVNSTRLGSPYTIRAIGDPAALEDAVREDPVASLLFTTYKSQFGLQAEVQGSQDVAVEAYRGSFRPQYVSSDQGGDR